MILGEPIILGGGGGIPVEIIAETEPGASVLCINGTTVLSKTANEEGKAAFEIKKEGLWVIQASLDGETVETEVLIEHNISEDLSFITADPILENNSWEVISAVARAGKAREFWNIGDEKAITINGQSNAVQIMDFDMYDVADPESYGRTKAGIVFQCKKTTAVGTWNLTRAMEEAETGISENSDCKDFVPTVKWPWRDTASEPSLYERKSFFPSEFELTGATTYEKVQVGTQYAFYAAGNSKIKYDAYSTSSSAVNWFTRSRRTTNNYVVYVKTDGTVAAATSSSSTYYVVPVFCI